MTTCRLCNEPRVSPFLKWDGEKYVNDGAWVRGSTGCLCATHEADFQRVRWGLYADMRIGQAVEAFCLAQSRPEDTLLH